MFPAAAPISWAASTTCWLIEALLAISDWIWPNVKVETVALPVTKAPSSPTNGAMKIQTDESDLERTVAIYTGILAILTEFKPELANICTMIKVTLKAIAVDFIEKTTFLAVGKKIFNDLTWINSPKTTATVINVPGEYRNSQSDLICSNPKMFVQEKFTADVRNSFSGWKTREANNIKITRMYDDQAVNNDIGFSIVLIS